MTEPTDLLNRLWALSRLLDSAYRLPGTNVTIGLDPLLGLFPGVGDAIGAALSTYIVYEARKLGVSQATLVRMVGNIIIDGLVGIIPILGDIFDAGYKANIKNMELIENDIAHKRG